MRNFIPKYCDEIFKATAEAQNSIVTQATHQQMLVLDQESDSVFTDIEVQNEFLKDQEGDGAGYRLVFLLGERGTGKSHLISWIRSRIQHLSNNTNYWVLSVSRNEGVMPILEKLRDLVIRKGHEDWVSDIEKCEDWSHDKIWQLTNELCKGKLTTLLEKDVPKRTIEDKQTGEEIAIGKIYKIFELDSRSDRKDIYNVLNTLLTSDRFIREFLIKESTYGPEQQGLLYKMVADHINPSRKNSKIVERKFEVDHFNYKGELFPNSIDRQQDFLEFQTEQSQYVELLNAILAEGLDDLITTSRTLKNFSLQEKIKTLRKNIHTHYGKSEQHEIIVLFEDLVAGASGNNLPEQINSLIMAGVDEGIVNGDKTRCTIRTMIGCTQGFYNQLPPETLKSRESGRRWVLAGQKHFKKEDAIDLVGKYLHSSRLGTESLRLRLEQNEKTWLDKLEEPQNADERKQLAAFDVSTEGYSLFPLNKDSIEQLYNKSIKNNSVLIRDLLNYVLKFLRCFDFDSPKSILEDSSPKSLDRKIFFNRSRVDNWYEKHNISIPSKSTSLYRELFNIYGCKPHSIEFFNYFKLKRIEFNDIEPISLPPHPINPPPPINPPLPITPAESAIKVAIETWYNQYYIDGDTYKFHETIVATPLRITAAKVLGVFGFSLSDKDYAEVYINSMKIRPKKAHIKLEPKNIDTNTQQLNQIKKILLVLEKLTKDFNLSSLEYKEQMLLMEWANSQRHNHEKHKKEIVQDKIKNNLTTLKNEDLSKCFDWTKFTIPILLELHSLQSEVISESDCMQAVFSRVSIPKDSLPDLPRCFLLEESNKINRSKDKSIQSVSKITNTIVKLHENHLIQNQHVPTSELLPYIKEWLKNRLHSPFDVQQSSTYMEKGNLRTFLLEYHSVYTYLQQIQKKVSDERKSLIDQISDLWGEQNAPKEEDLSRVASLLYSMDPYLEARHIPESIKFLFHKDWKKAYAQASNRSWQLNQDFEIPSQVNDYMAFRSSTNFKAIQDVILFGEEIQKWFDFAEKVFKSENPNQASQKTAFNNDITSLEQELDKSISKMESHDGEE